MPRHIELIDGLVNRLAEKLLWPKRGESEERTRREIDDDSILTTTRETLVHLSETQQDLGSILEPLVVLLEQDLTGSRTGAREYILSLLGDCCQANWSSLDRIGDNVPISQESNNEEIDEAAQVPPCLDNCLVIRLLDALGSVMEPLKDDSLLPAHMLLGVHFDADFQGAGSCGEIDSLHSIDTSIKTIAEYATASSWSACMAYVRKAMSETGLESPTHRDERSTLTTLRLVGFFWVDSVKLGTMLQEVCSYYLRLGKAAQNTLAAVLPLLIVGWVQRFPGQFAQLHKAGKRLDSSVDRLLDLIQAAVSNSRRKMTIQPLQMALLILRPDVFEAATRLSSTKSSSVNKRVHVLDGLSKAMRNGNERAVCSLVLLLRVARHLWDEAECSLTTYALDVHGDLTRLIVSQATPTLDQKVLASVLFVLILFPTNNREEMVMETCAKASARPELQMALVRACCLIAKAPTDGSEQRLRFAMPMMQTMFEQQYDESQLSGPLVQTNVDIVGATISLLETYPWPLMEELSSKRQGLGFSRPFVKCIFSSHPSIRVAAGRLAMKLSTHTESLGYDEDRCDLGLVFWKQSCAFVPDLCARVQSQGSLYDLQALYECLRARLSLLQALPALLSIPSDSMNISDLYTPLETTLLVELCTADVEAWRIVSSSIKTVLLEVSLLQRHGASSQLFASESSPMLRNHAIYLELASLVPCPPGLALCRVLRRMQYPSQGILSAWELAFDRWIHLAKELSILSADTTDDMVLGRWINLSGFLASMASVCVVEGATALGEEAVGDLRCIDRACDEEGEEPLLVRFLRLSVQLSGCSNSRVGQAMRRILSDELSPLLHQALLKALESELEVLSTGALASPDGGSDCELVFAEQAAFLIMKTVETLESGCDLTTPSPVHLGALTLGLAKFVDSVPGALGTQGVKIGVCNLCEAITKRKERLNLRDDVRIRNQLVDCIFGWLARPRQQHDGSNDLDVDTACLGALGLLTFRLPLQAVDVQRENATSEQKSRKFHTYFNHCLSLITWQSRESNRSKPYSESTLACHMDAPTCSDLVIEILSNLLSANIDVGLKPSLSIGYHQNMDIRAAFLTVLSNILAQGTEFRGFNEAATSEKHQQLLHLLTKDISLVLALSDCCPASEVDELTVCLLTVFEQRGQVFELFETLVRHEIQRTENESEILRRTCVATKMLSVYAKWKGASYLRGTLQRVIERLTVSSQDLSLELDPSRVGSTEELQKNAVQLQAVAKAFMDDICASVSIVPASFRRICSIIMKVVACRFPNAKYTAVGAFIFLRFICPAIVAPESEGLVVTAPTKEMRRGLLLIAKVIQNLANNVLFGVKEPYMFPLNPFLVHNIHLVAGFLRDISVAPDHVEMRPHTELVDLGSCVSIHRFIYDHWDQLRQTLAHRERREHVRSPAELARGTPSMRERLQGLITRLGPPPLAMSWNRPQVSTNPPPLYSRFQNFMLRNAFRGIESFLTSRAVYDGGESKDGLSIVCVILRHMENESLDYDTLLYCYLKIASRLWHEPFGLFVDATCYRGRTEPADDFLASLDLLTPSELSLNLSRIYVYNMNSAFKKCFRRLLRVSTRNECGAFNPKNVDYHLIGSLQELQAHFHLSQLHLPKETISVVTDTRFVLQPVTRLSKSKGKVDVVIKVGSQFVQVTTAKKQEVLSGLRLGCAVNDIFRLGDVEESTTTAYSLEENAFGLKAEGGKVVMAFTSPKRTDVLEAIRHARDKHVMDDKATRLLDRLVRPQDVPGTMLNLALSNLSGAHHDLRQASYNLLGALCRAFHFEAGSRLFLAKDLLVPLDASRLMVNMSRELAQSEPHLTWDFLTEFFLGWQSLLREQRPLSLEYVAPWLSGLRTAVLACEPDCDKGREKVAAIFRKLLDLVVMPDRALGHALEHHVWPSVAEDQVLVDIMLDELIKGCLSRGAKTDMWEMASSVLIGIGSISLRGRVLSRLRRAINRSSLRPTKSLPENAVWAEVCLLLRFSMALSFDSGIQCQLFLPEVLHIVTMLSDTGGHDFSLMVQGLLVNTVHAACTSFALSGVRLAKLRASLQVLHERRRRLFAREAWSKAPETTWRHEPETTMGVTAAEELAATLAEICQVAAPSVDLSNAWRSRWMSLVASTAFQNNPAVQPRAFAVMGYLARGEIDDDLVYQVLVALRGSISQYLEDGSSEMMASVVTSLSKMMTNLSSASRYGVHLFWLAMSLVRLVSWELLKSAVQLLEAVVINLTTAGDIGEDNVASVLLHGHEQLQGATAALDRVLGIRFHGLDTFHFAVCACLVRGLSDMSTRVTTMRLLSCLVEITVSNEQQTLPYLVLMSTRCMSDEELMDGLWWWADIDDAQVNVVAICHNMPDERLGLLMAIVLTDLDCLDEVVQARALEWVTQVAAGRQAAMSTICRLVSSVVDGVLLHGQSRAGTDTMAMQAMQTTALSPTFADVVSFAALLPGGRKASDGDRASSLECLGLVNSMIEFIIT
ncbi:hypothetical protein CDD81_2488 [Ophiocordyceps australis]|uniref:Ras-GAP domain-containing protein n=1 Tax=Ophiocordyceps australis TaxID=1399860 RepID=A0A2C5YEI0_9HYPO|nr:hypothetical protein CDD81_2488 [Ophiocordyceps australis]